MLFDQLIQILDQGNRMTVIKCANITTFSDIAFLEGNEKQFDSDILYFGYATQLAPGCCMPKHCILEGNPSSVNLTGEIEDCAIISDSSIFSVFNRTRAVLDQSGGRWLYEELLRKAEQSHDLQAVVNLSSVKLGDPLVLIDLDFKVISYSTISPITDKLWRKNVENGYCSYEFIKATLSMKELQNPCYPTDTIEVTCTESPYRKLCNRIFFRGAHVGYAIMIASDAPVSPSHFSMMTTISQVVSYVLANDFPTLFQKSDQYEKVLYNLLIGASPNELYPEIGMLSFAQKMAALVIRPKKYYGADYIRKQLSPVINQSFPKVHFTYHDNLVVALLPLEGANDVSSEEIVLLDSIAEKENLEIGVSNIFSNIEHFPLHFSQAKAAVLLGKRLSDNQRVFKYLDYLFYDLLAQIPSKIEIGRYCHPALALLRIYDTENGTDLYHTLFAYLENGCNAKLASGKLFVHRNSMVYRLERISEIGNIDIRDTDTIFLLRISYAIDRFLGHDQ